MFLGDAEATTMGKITPRVRAMGTRIALPASWDHYLAEGAYNCMSLVSIISCSIV